MTLNIAFFDLSLFFVGILIDQFGCRFVKLISMWTFPSFSISLSLLFSVAFVIFIGWLFLALLEAGRDYPLYIHCISSLFSGIVIVITSYASSNYFAKSRAYVAALLAGAGISSTMWSSIYQVFSSSKEKEILTNSCFFEVWIDSGRIRLNILAYIWLAYGLLISGVARVRHGWATPNHRRFYWRIKLVNVMSWIQKINFKQTSMILWLTQY